MSDKFVVSTNTVGEIIVTDVETGTVYHYGSMSNFLGLIRLLNEQNEKIKKLHRDVHIGDELDKEKLEALKDAETKIQLLEKENEDLREVNKENQLLHEENVKQCERWKTLYELKDKEVTARVDALNKVCEYYTSEVLFKSDVDPNKSVKEVINRIMNTEVE